MEKKLSDFKVRVCHLHVQPRNQRMSSWKHGNHYLQILGVRCHGDGIQLGAGAHVTAYACVWSRSLYSSVCRSFQRYNGRVVVCRHRTSNKTCIRSLVNIIFFDLFVYAMQYSVSLLSLLAFTTKLALFYICILSVASLAMGHWDTCPPPSSFEEKKIMGTYKPRSSP